MSSKSGTYRAAIFGLGAISRAHLGGYRTPENATRVQVIAGADISEEARGRFTADSGIERTYAHYGEVQERERPDVVSTCTWPPFHPEMVEAAAAAGVRGIVCEKPMAVDLAGCDRMLAAAERAGTLLVVGHQRRLQPKFARARALIEEGAIGAPELLCGIAAGDLLTDGTHTVDALRFFAGDAPVEWVMGTVDLRPREVRQEHVGRSGFAAQERPFTVRYGHPIESGAVAMLQFADGRRATLELGICRRRTPSAKRLPKLEAPAADGLVARRDPPFRQELFHIPIAEQEAVAQPRRLPTEIRELIASMARDGPRWGRERIHPSKRVRAAAGWCVRRSFSRRSRVSSCTTWAAAGAPLQRRLDTMDGPYRYVRF